METVKATLFNHDLPVTFRIHGIGKCGSKNTYIEVFSNIKEKNIKDTIRMLAESFKNERGISVKKIEVIQNLTGYNKIFFSK